MLMKISKAVVVPLASGVASLGVLATCGLLLIQNGTRPTSTPIVDQHVAVVSSVAHSSSAAVAKPAAVVPRSSVVVKKPTVQGATVTDPASTDPASAPVDSPSAQPIDTEAPGASPTAGRRGGPYSTGSTVIGDPYGQMTSATPTASPTATG